MPNKARQTFLVKVSDLSNERCGEAFAREMSSLRSQRERLLANSWHEVSPEDFTSGEKEEVFREIDFDAIITNAAGYLERDDYPAFLFDVAEIAIGFGEFDKAQRVLEIVVSKLARSSDKLLLAKAHERLGNLAFYRGDRQATLKAYRKCLRYYSGLNDTKGVAEVKNAMGAALIERGKPSEGEPLLKEVREMARSHGFAKLLTKANINLGNHYSMEGSWKEGLACYREALGALGKTGNDADMRALIFLNMAIIQKEQGQFSRALGNLSKSLKFSSESNNIYQKGLTYLEQAEVSCRKRDLAAGTALATTAFRIFSESGDLLRVAEVYRVFGMINRDKKRFDTALSYFENSRRINEDHSNPRNLGETHFEIAELYKAKGETAEAQESLKSAIKYFKRVKAEAKTSQAKVALEALAA